MRGLMCLVVYTMFVLRTRVSATFVVQLRLAEYHFMSDSNMISDKVRLLTWNASFAVMFL